MVQINSTSYMVDTPRGMAIYYTETIQSKNKTTIINETSNHLDCRRQSRYLQNPSSSNKISS